MFDRIRPFFTTPPRRPTSQLGAGMSDEDEPAIPAFQQAWKQGATVENLFGSSPYTLHGSVGRSGADNHRPDVAKVETFLGDAGYYKPLTNDGPSGWHNANLDSAIRSFQKDKGLEVDGLLKPNGPTIGKIAETAHGFWEGPNNDHRDVLKLPSSPRPPKPPMDAPDLPDGDIWEKPQPPMGGQDDLEALIRIMNGGQKPEPTGTPPYRPTPPPLPPVPRPHDGGIAHPPTTLPDRFPGHTISESGAKEHDDWVKLLVRDSDPSQTARMLKGAITEYGDQGRGDVADILGRFHQLDPTKAEILRRAVRDATGEDLPFRIAPRGEGFRELTDEEKLARTPKSPFGSAQGADRWAAGNMAEALLAPGRLRRRGKAFPHRQKRDHAVPGRRARDHGRKEPHAGDEVRQTDERGRPGAQLRRRTGAETTDAPGHRGTGDNAAADTGADQGTQNHKSGIGSGAGSTVSGTVRSTRTQVGRETRSVDIAPMAAGQRYDELRRTRDPHQRPDPH